MEFITAKQYAEKMGVTPRHIQELCRRGAIQGVTRHGREWLIPASAVQSKEDDSVQKRLPEAPAKQTPPKLAASGGIIDLYKRPGSAAELLMSLSHDEYSYDIFASQLAFYRGDHKTALTLALKHFNNEEKDVAKRIAVGMQLMTASLYSGDLKVWRKGFDYIKSIECKTEYGQATVDFWLATAVSAVSDEDVFPEWFQRGDFTRLPPSSYAMASYSYVKHLYNKCGKEKEKERALELVRAMPYAIEPLVSYIFAGGVVLIEIYLRLVCALSYHLIGNDALAIPHLDRAIDLALPDKLFTPLAEYRRRFGFLMDDRVAMKSPEALAEIKVISKTLIEGWTAIHNEILGKRVASNLSTREWQASRLAAYGLSNKDIAERMGVTVNAVKQALRMAMDKTGAESRDELANYI